jgi:hypothetical protein
MPPLGQLRQRRIEVPLESESEEGDASFFTDRQEDPFEHASGHEFGQRLGIVLQGLSRAERCAFVLRHFEQYPLEDIAGELGCKRQCLQTDRVPRRAQAACRAQSGEERTMKASMNPISDGELLLYTTAMASMRNATARSRMPCSTTPSCACASPHSVKRSDAWVKPGRRTSRTRAGSPGLGAPGTRAAAAPRVAVAADAAAGDGSNPCARRRWPSRAC